MLPLCAFVSCAVEAAPARLELFSPVMYVPSTAQTMYFPLTRTGDAGYDVALNYYTVDDSALAGSDYQAVANFTTLPNGIPGTFLPVLIYAQAATGTSKIFTLQLESVVGVGPQPNLGVAQIFPVGRSPYAVVAADINGDGKPDSIVSNTDDNTVSVLFNTTTLGAATSTFASQQVFVTGRNPYAAVADINSDGKPDIITANLRDDTVSVLLNTTTTGATTGSFSTQQTFATGHNPRAILATDINLDGLADIVVANVYDNTVSVLLNTTVPGAATASLAPHLSFPMGMGTNSLAAADFNGDGRMDLVSANFVEHDASVLINTTLPGAGTPSFAAQRSFATGQTPSWVTEADINGDGKPDVIVANNDNSQSLSVLLNTTTSGSMLADFAAQQVVSTSFLSSSFSIFAADVNGDGRTDVLVSGNDPGGGGVVFLLNRTSPGSFSARFIISQKFAAGALPVALAVADVNGDGKPDPIVANLSLRAVSVLLNTSLLPSDAIPSFDPQEFFVTGSIPSSVATADFNGDGRLDVVVSNNNGRSGNVAVLLNTTVPGAAHPSLAPQQIFHVGSNPRSVTISDFNSDGLCDLVVVNQGDNTVSVLLNTTPAGASTFVFAPQRVFAVGSGPHLATIADVNGDGRPDIVVANYDDNTVSLLLNNTVVGATIPSFVKQQVFATQLGPLSVAASDLNHDGSPDLVVDNYLSNTVSVLVNTTPTGATTAAFATQQSFAVGIEPNTMATGDINGDGLPDVVVGNSGNESVSMLTNSTVSGSGSISFLTGQMFVAGNGTGTVALGDVDGDGKPDLFVSRALSNTVFFLLNNTTPGAAASFRSGVPLAAGAAPYALALADLSGDGKPDLVVANREGGNLSVLLNSQYQVLTTGNPATGTILHDVILADGFEP